MSRISTEVSEDQHHKIKILASLRKMTIKELVLENIFNNSNEQYNLETFQALDGVKNDRNLNVYNTVDELFKKLGT